jgi:hypothetical protein
MNPPPSNMPQETKEEESKKETSQKGTQPSPAKAKKSIRVVIARYRELLDWLPLIPEDYEIYVSNSGGVEAEIPEGVRKRTKVVNVPNGGRECGHWWRYILSNYDRLADIQIFLQASPHIGHTNDILFGDWLEPDIVISRIDEAEGFSYIYDRSIKRGLAGGNFDAHMLICQAHGRKYLPLPPPAGATDWGGQHFVSREVIQNRPKDFYQGMVNFGCSADEVANEVPAAALLKHRTSWIYERAMNIIYNIWPDK